MAKRSTIDWIRQIDSKPHKFKHESRFVRKDRTKHIFSVRWWEKSKLIFMAADQLWLRFFVVVAQSLSILFRFFISRPLRRKLVAPFFFSCRTVIKDFDIIIWYKLCHGRKKITNDGQREWKRGQKLIDKNQSDKRFRCQRPQIFEFIYSWSARNDWILTYGGQ